MARILLIEDNETLREGYSAMLEMAFLIRIVQARSGNDAIEVLSIDRNFNLIISDYKMTEGLGSDVLKYLVRVKSEIPFVYFSNAIEELSGHGYDKFLGVIQKDKFSKLVEVVRYAMG